MHFLVLHVWNTAQVHLHVKGKLPLKLDCFAGSTVKSKTQPILYCFALDKPISRKIFSKLRSKHREKIKKSDIGKKEFFLEDDKHKIASVNGGTITFSIKLKKIQLIKINCKLCCAKNQENENLFIEKNTVTFIEQTKNNSTRRMRVPKRTPLDTGSFDSP